MPLKQKFKKKRIRVKKKVYIKQQCAFFKENGKRCSRLAVGSSTLCVKHGGKRIDIENTVSTADTKAVVKTRGAGVSFDPSTHPMWYIELSKAGNSDVEIAALFQVSVQLLREWSSLYREFAVAYEVGQSMHEAWWLEKGKAGLENYKFNTTLYKYLTGNKLGYSDRIENKTVNLHHLHGVLLVPDKVSTKQWESDYVDAEFSEEFKTPSKDVSEDTQEASDESPEGS